MRPAAAIAAGLLLAVAAGPAASQQVVPGARAEIVQLDAVVTDARGAVVRDLTQDDFQILLDAAGHSDVVLQAQVWSAGKATAVSPVQPVRFQHKEAVPVPETNVMALEGLPTGPYDLRVVVQDRKAGTTTFRRVPFTID